MSEDSSNGISGPFRSPTRVHFGAGVFERLPQILQQAVARSLHRVDVAAASGSVLLVYDRGLAATPWPTAAQRLLKDAGWGVEHFDGVENNPRGDTVDAATEQARRAGVAAVVGLGGGSVLDAAKAVALLAARGGTVTEAAAGGRVATASLPFVAVPTTCGTGSEVTWVSVISIPQDGVKISLKGDGMFPAAAVVDPDVLRSLPRGLVASTALDAMTHALEATTGRLANPVSDVLAREAIAGIFRWLRQGAANIAEDGEARQGLLYASTIAGLAFGSSDVGAVHCLSESLGGLYDVPHGLANALLLAPTMRAHGDSVTSTLASLADCVGASEGKAGAAAGGSEEERAEAFLQGVESLVEDLELPPFSSLGVPAGREDLICRMAVANGSNSSNPRPMGEAEYREILARL
ncbi:MAG: iron-containing alcohol dehydrogenase [Acidobacteriota bacterium]